MLLCNMILNIGRQILRPGVLFIILYGIILEENHLTKKRMSQREEMNGCKSKDKYEFGYI